MCRASCQTLQPSSRQVRRRESGNMKHGTIVQNMWQPSDKSYLVYMGTSGKYANCLWIINGKLANEIHKYYKKDILNDREHFPVVGYIDYKKILTDAVMESVKKAKEET